MFNFYIYIYKEIIIIEIVRINSFAMKTYTTKCFTYIVLLFGIEVNEINFVNGFGSDFVLTFR